VGVIAPSEFIEDDNVTLTCAVSKLNKSEPIEWKKLGTLDNWMPIDKLNGIIYSEQSWSLFYFCLYSCYALTSMSIGVKIEDMETKWSRRRILSVERINKSFDGRYACFVGGKEIESTKSVKIDVKGQFAVICFFLYLSIR